MARIRSIKPEFWTSAQVMECSPMARLLFVGMWNFADDAGRMTYSPKTLKAQIYPSDDITSADVERMLVELSSNGLLLLYSSDGKELISITGWHHQKIDKPRPSKLPAPFAEGSTTIRRKVATDPILGDRKGRDHIQPDRSSGRASAKRGTRLPDEWGPSHEDWNAALLKLAINGADQELLKFKDYWKAQPGQRGCKLDWDATWRNWVRNAKGTEHGRRTTVHDAARELSENLLALDEPAPTGLCEPASGGVVRLLPSR